MKKIFLYINFLLLLLLLALYVTSIFNPFSIPMVNLSSVLLPCVALFIFFHFLLFLLFRYSQKWLYFTGIIFAILILTKSFYINFGSTKDGEANLKVLSYNVSFFSVETVFKKDYYDPNHNKEVSRIRELINNEKPDVICFQEFFNDKNSDIYNTVARFKKLGYQNFLKSNPRHDNGLNRGLITFSKYPIIKSEIIAESNKEYNGAILTDLKVSDKDTIRLINVHLSSMELYKGRKSWISFIKSFYRAYTAATKERIKQLESIKSYLINSPYELILAGDFNETPYSYIYQSVNSLLDNSFEAEGHGVGTTFSFKIPGVGVRIDHMFHTSSIKILDFNTLKELEYSEHKPIIGSFKVK